MSEFKITSIIGESSESSECKPPAIDSGGGTSVEKSASCEPFPTPREIISLLGQYVIGQDRAKREIAVAVYNHFMSCAMIGQNCKNSHSDCLLLVGPTGTGKSHLLKTLAKVTSLPLIYIPCTNISPNGYKGLNLTSIIKHIGAKLMDDSSDTRPGIVVWDEIDKLADNGSLDGSYKKLIQQDFLTYLDGTLCGAKSDFDSSKVLNIACGAFPGIDKLRLESPKGDEIGFHSLIENDFDNNKHNLQELEPSHLIGYGMIPEFVGRFSRLASLDPIDASVMRRILCEAKDNVWFIKKEFFAAHGIRLELTEDGMDEVVAQALVQPTGARSLKQIIGKMLKSVEHMVPDLPSQGVCGLIYDRDAVSGKDDPLREMGANSSILELQRLRTAAGLYAGQLLSNPDEDDMIQFW